MDSARTRSRLNASQLPLYVGTSGWAYTIWKPDFYPKEVASKNFLKYYATQLNAVEVNYTFRRSLTEKAATGWMADVGPDFRFALKANQYITHIKRLQNVEEPMQRFLPTLQPLATQLGPVLFQLPPTPKPTLRCCAIFWRCCREISKRRSSFATNRGFADEVYQVLRRSQCDPVRCRDGEAGYARSANRELYLLSLSSAQLFGGGCEELAERWSKCVADGLETYAFFKHEEDPRSPQNAVELLNSVRRKQSERLAGNTDPQTRKSGAAPLGCTLDSFVLIATTSPLSR